MEITSSIGNKFDDIRIDLTEYHGSINQVRANKKKRNGFFKCWINFFIDALVQKLKLGDILALAGLRVAWFNEFCDFWVNLLGGRPISVMDFHLLRFDYRKRCQSISAFDWSSKESHLKNWQNPNYLSSVFNYVYKFAQRPIQFRDTWKYLKNDSKVLEYGCSLAPGFRNYRDYFAYRNIEWHLADIPNHTFLYSKFTYSQEPLNVKFHDILPENMNAPIQCEDNYFDVIYCNMVYEHLNSPLEVSKFHMKKLKKGGVYIFDYVKSDGTELDTEQGVHERQETLKFLKDSLEVISGDLSNLNEDISLVVARKK